jgi:hypothetical protein
MSDDLRQLAVDLSRAAKTVDPRKFVQVEAHRIKQDWQREWTGIRGMPHIARSVTYDTKLTASGAEAEIGPDPDRPQGPLDNIVEYGGSTQGPIRPVTPRLVKDAGDRMEKYLSEQVEDLL